MKRDVEKMLIASADGSFRREHFVDGVMQRVGEPEIISNEIRRMNDQPVKKGSFMMQRLKTMSLPVLVLLAVLGVLFVGGVVYATVQYIWPKLHIVTESQENNEGHVATLVKVSGCVTFTQEQIKVESQKNVSWSQQEVRERLQASCEMAAVEHYVSQLNLGLDTVKEAYVMEPCVGVVSGSIGSFVTLPRCNQAIGERRVTIDSATKFIVDGRIASRNELKNGTAFAVISRVSGDYAPGATYPAGAVIALGLAPKAYAYVGETMAYIQPCQNNLKDECHTHVAEDPLYDRIYAEGETADETPTAQYEGRVQKVNGDTIEFKTSSGTSMVMTLPAGTAAAYNKTTRTRQPLAVGDLVQVVASWKKTTLGADDVSHAAIVVQTDLSSGTITKY